MKNATVKEQKFYHAEDVAKILGVSLTTGYRIIKKLNDELREQGKIIIPGKISKRFFNEKVYM
ncbi:transcriptional regulator [Tepidibacter hydrothermalis]|uniref:Transcriptional regulator n=1 Tax=Tepidibacter hydrothermalis TaxID=3036126 RepID=A0ABY8EAK8_9FIRM|nr:transcriptional regulator [Tepidibacter hydrothermalis]WFD09968.1 transcriptional regulator [Tepidibacter hydrothermalis]